MQFYFVCYISKCCTARFGLVGTSRKCGKKFKVVLLGKIPCGETVGKEQIAIDALKAKYAGDEEFAAYEAMKAHMKENRENLELLKKK